MAERTGNDNAYSTGESWAPSLQSEYTQDPYIMSLFNKEETPAKANEGGWSGMSDSAKQQSLQTGLQAGQAGGGLGGALTGAGASAALAGAGPVGWGVMAGGLLLSAHEKKKQEEAAREQARVQAEMDKRSALIQLARDSAKQDFRLV